MLSNQSVTSPGYAHIRKAGADTMKKSICAAVVSASMMLSPFTILANTEAPEAHTIIAEPRNVETWYGEGSVSAGSATVYLAATMTYSNGSWGARAWVTSAVGCTASVVSAAPVPTTGTVTGSVSINGIYFNY